MHFEYFVFFFWIFEYGLYGGTNETKTFEIDKKWIGK